MRTPEFVIDHLKLRDASHFTVRVFEELLPLLLLPCPSEEALPLMERDEADVPLMGGGKSFATHRSPWGDGVSR